MQEYYGTKKLFAKPMTLGDYNALRGWTIPADEDPEKAGYLVEYTDGGKPNVSGFIGYVSWSPKDVFEKAYQKTNGLSFGHAIEALKEGRKVSRAGWNGKGMWLMLVAGAPKATLKDGSPYKVATGLDECEILPHIDMWTVNAHGRTAMLPGWLASQTDMLANDWCVVE